MGESTMNRSGYRSLFWPIVLIAIGVIWLLGNAGVLNSANLIVLLRLWPLLLIVIGLDLLFGRQSPALGALIGIGAVVAIIVLMLVGPSIGLAGPSREITTSSYVEAREDATAVYVELNLSVANTKVSALTESDDLFTAEVTHIGKLDYRVEGEARKSIYLGEEDSQDNVLFGGAEFLGRIFGVDDESLTWDIGLSPDVPVTLDINGGVGNSEFDLSGLQIENFVVNGGVGNIRADLPAMEDSYNATINSGTGEISITLAADSALNLNINGGVGNVIIDVPEGAAVQVVGQSGVGNIQVPENFQRVDGDDDNFLGSSGIWETRDFNEASRRITIQYSGGVGNLTVR